MTTAPHPRRRNKRGSGDRLRGEIVAAAKDLLEHAESSAEVSVRAVATAVGVTPPSIYLHFADKEALLDAVVADVFAELDAAMLTAADGIEEPLEVLCAYGLAYVRFAIDHPEHYRLATMERRPAGTAASDVDAVLAESAFTHLEATVTRCIAAGVFAEGDRVAITLEMWVAAHGVASLVISKPFLPWGDPMDFAFSALRSVALGHAVNDLAGGDLSPRDAARWLDRLRG